MIALPQEPYRQAGRQILHPPGPFGKSRQALHRNPACKPDMARRKALSLQLFGPFSRHRRIRNHKIERRRFGKRMARRGNNRLAPRLVPPRSHKRQQRRHVGQAGLQPPERSKYAMDQSPWPTFQ